MKNLKLLIVIFCISFISCGSDSPGSAACSNNFSEEFQDELTAVTNAATAYSQDPTSANCQAFKDAYLDYIDALEDWEDCAAINNSTAEFNESLKEARDSVNDLEC